jgi:uncharacterized repeat protein (TIGR03803 family)
MKTNFKILFSLPSLVVWFSLTMMDWVAAQPSEFTTLYTFSAVESFANDDGAAPHGGLILAGDTLYGTATAAGPNEYGTVFSVKLDGSGFTVLHAFDWSDGGHPYCGLVLANKTLFGTTSEGGDNYGGTVFSIDTNGANFNVLFSFSGLTDGMTPYAGLILAGDMLYGTTALGSPNSSGTVFGIGTNGSGFTVLHTFSAISEGDNGTNGDGSSPYAALVLSGNTLYGTTTVGGLYAAPGLTYGAGTVFSVTTNATPIFAIVHYFTGGDDGSAPIGGLIISGNTLYGTASYLGGYPIGTVFAVETNGTFSTLYSFPTSDFAYESAQPTGTLLLDNEILYGTTFGGTATGSERLPGTVFALNTNGTSFRVVHYFDDPTNGPDYNTEGYWPYAGVVLSSNDLYGTTTAGGTNNYGTVYGLPLPATFVAVAYNSTNVVYSPDGTNWFADPHGMPSSDAWAREAYGDSKFVTIAYGDESVPYSYDGVNWIANANGMPSSNNWVALTYGNGTFVATAWASDALAYSSDGITWSSTTTMPSSDNWYCLAYGTPSATPTFVAIVDGDSSAAYSSDGITWHTSSGGMPYSAAWQSVAYGTVGSTGYFVAIVGGSNKSAYSTDGIHWTAGSGLPDNDWAWVTYGNGVFVATAYGSDVVAYSTTGTSWTTSLMPFSDDWYMAAYGNGTFVALSQGDGQAAVSSDGIHWSDVSDDLPFDDTWYSLAAW